MLAGKDMSSRTRQVRKGGKGKVHRGALRRDTGERKGAVSGTRHGLTVVEWRLV